MNTIPMDNCHKPLFSINDIKSADSISNIIHRIGHDIGNPLTSIISFSSLLDRSDIFDSSKIKQFAGSIHSEAWRIGKLSETMVLLFSNKSGLLEYYPIERLLDQALEKISIRYGVRLDTVLDASCKNLEIKIDNEQGTFLIEELLYNAYCNSVPQTKIEINARKNQDSIELVVTNQISGLYELELSNFFNPLFTYPDYKKTTGLGLTAVYAILDRVGANIALSQHSKSNLNYFTTHCFFKDAIFESEKKSISSNIKLLFPCNISVLLIEDEDSIRLAIRKIIDLSYGKQSNVVIEEAMGSDALLLLTNESRYDLIFCDHNLKDIKGNVVIEHIKKTCPQNYESVIFMSGEKTQSLETFKSQYDLVPILCKPFTAEDLIAVINKKLE